MLAAAYIRVFRIDFNEEPSVANGGLEVVILTLVMALVLPQALIPFGGALVVYLAVCALKSRGIPVLELRWIAMVVLPTALMAAYYGVVLWSNDKMRDVWLGQVDAPSAHPVLIVLGYGLLLFTAIPGLVRALRRFEQDGDQLMLIWLVVNFVVVFIPFNQQRRLMTGLIIPVAFFAVRSLEDYWLSLIKSDRLRYIAMLALFVFIMPSNVLALGLPLFGLVNPEAGIELRLMVERGYWEAMGWLSQNGKPDDVVLSSPNVGLWIPAWAGKRVVYGHPWETLDAATKLAQVERWYQGRDCDGLLSRYGVRYVLVGPQERAISAGNVRGDACYASLEESASRVVDFTDVTLYELGN